jgi:hypothetical protein
LSLFDFAGPNDVLPESYGPGFVDALKAIERVCIALIYCALVLYLALQVFCGYLLIAQNTAIIIVGLLMVSDLYFVDKNYVSAKD